MPVPDQIIRLCPAATGESNCPTGRLAHRCRLDQAHVRDTEMPATDRVAHVCACGYMWTCLSGKLDGEASTITKTTDDGALGAFSRGMQAAVDELRRMGKLP